jgi:selenocysteine lyase/cysteine desulfurase
MGFILDRDFDIAVRVGLHCAPLAHRTIGTFPEGTVRVSPGIFNTREDIDCFLSAIKEIAAGRARGSKS